MDLSQLLGDPLNRRPSGNGLLGQDRTHDLEMLLGSRATQSQGGMVLLGHGRQGGEEPKPALPFPHTNSQIQFSSSGGGARHWNQSGINIAGFLEGNQSAWRREQGSQIPRFPLVDAKPQWELSEVDQSKERSSIKKKGFLAGANGRGSDPLRRARARGAGARKKANPKLGVAEKALACARDLRKLEEETLALENKYFSDTSKKGKISRAETVSRVAIQIAGGHPFPLSKLTVVRVAACIRSAGIQSGDQYLSELRTMQVEHGHQVGELLDRTFKLCQRALRRDKGPECRAPEIAWHEVKEELFWWNLPGKKAVKMPVLAYAWAFMWMLREIELREVRLGDVKLNRESKHVTLLIRKSKMDQTAKGVRRTLACVCKESNCQVSCPWALSLMVMAAVRNESRDTLLFGTTDGFKASKSCMVKAWQELLHKDARGHSARRSGAMFYVRQGMSIQDLAYLGRWKSNAVLRYAEEALETQPINLNYQNRLEVEQLVRLSKRSRERPEEEDDLETTVEEVKPHPDENIAEHDEVQEVIQAEVNPLVKKQEMDLYVKSTGRSKTKPVHKVTLANWQEPTSKWSTACGWKFAAKSNRFVFISGSRKTTLTCSKCLEAESKRDDVKEVESWRLNLPDVVP